MVNNILITEKNYDDFKAVLPPGLFFSDERITLGCYEDDGTVLGALSFILSSYEYKIDWLYVIPEKQGNGIATGLLDTFSDFVRKTGEIYPVTAQFEVAEQDMSLYGFFLSVEGMDVSYSHKRYYVDNRALKDSKELKKDVMVKFDEKLFFKMDKSEQERVLQEIDDEGVYVVEDYDHWVKCCVPELCRVMYLEDEIKGAVFVLWRTDGNLEFSFIHSTNPVCTKALVNVTASDITKYFPRCSLVFDAVVPQSEKMAEKLFPDTEPIDIYEAEW